MSIWYINDVALSDLAVSGLSRRLVSQAADTVEFQISGAAFDADLTGLAFGDAVTIKRGTAVWFRGTVSSVPRRADPGSEPISVTVSGPWYNLTRTPFETTWNGQLATFNKGRVVLFRNSAGTRISIGAQIAEILTLAVARGVALSWEASDLTATELAIKPTDAEMLDVTCDEAMRACLRWAPGVVTWFDYSTATPTLRFARIADPANTPVEIARTNVAGALGITRRDDLVVPGVLIKYEHTHTVADTEEADGGEFLTVTEDSAGSTAAAGALIATCSLQGAQSSTVKQKIVTETFHFTDGGSPVIDTVAFWKRFAPWLNDVTSLSIHGGTVVDENAAAVTWARVLMEGQITDWMRDKRNIVTKIITVRAKADYLVKEGSDPLIDFKDVEMSMQMIATSAKTRTYTYTSIEGEADLVPVGVAAALYSVLAIPHYEGEAVIEGEECSLAYRPGQLLNVTGGRAEWATMKAVIQEVQESLETGTTRLSFGPPNHLQFDDYLELLRTFRISQASSSNSQRATGSAAGDDAIQMSGVIPQPPATAGQKFKIANIMIVNGDYKVSLTAGGTGYEAYRVLTVGADGLSAGWDWTRAHA